MGHLLRKRFRKNLDKEIEDILNNICKHVKKESELDKALQNSEMIIEEFCEAYSLKIKDYRKLADIWRCVDYFYMKHMEETAKEGYEEYLAALKMDQYKIKDYAEEKIPRFILYIK